MERLDYLLVLRVTRRDFPPTVALQGVRDGLKGIGGKLGVEQHDLLNGGVLLQSLHERCGAGVCDVVEAQVDLSD